MQLGPPEKPCTKVNGGISDRYPLIYCPWVPLGYYGSWWFPNIPQSTPYLWAWQTSHALTALQVICKCHYLVWETRGIDICIQPACRVRYPSSNPPRWTTLLCGLAQFVQGAGGCGGKWCKDWWKTSAIPHSSCKYKISIDNLSTNLSLKDCLVCGLY